MNETRSGVNDRPRPSVVSRSSRRQLPTVTLLSPLERNPRDEGGNIAWTKEIFISHYIRFYIGINSLYI